MAAASIGERNESFFSVAGRKARNVLPHLIICANSASLRSVAQASFRSIPYVFRGSVDSREIVSTRWMYFKAGFCSSVSLTQSATKFTFSALRSGWHLGKNADANYALRKNWIETAYSLGSVSVSAMGTAFPTLGVYTSGVLFTMIVRYLNNQSDQEIPSLPVIRDIYKKNKDFFVRIIREVGAQNHATEVQVSSAINNVDTHVSDAQTSQELFDNVGADVSSLVPEPPPTPEALYYMEVAEAIRKGTQELNDIIAGKYLPKDFSSPPPEDPTWDKLSDAMREDLERKDEKKRN